MSEAPSVVGPVPGAADRAPSWLHFARSMGHNALDMFPPRAFEEEFVTREFFGRQQVIINRAAGIQHILIDNAANYRRTAAGIRILRPLLGRGLLLSTGEDWRRQRHALAPAFAPRTMPILARHVARAAALTVTRLRGSGATPVDLLAAMQFLALEIAAVSMFSLEMDRYGAPLRRLITEYAARFGRPGLLDFLLPPSLPSPRDIGRWRFRRRWLDLIRRIIAARQAQGSAGAPRDLFDLISQARDPESGQPFAAGQLTDQVATMIVAGHETTAVALFWALFLLAAEPSMQQRLAAEAAPLDLSPEGAPHALSKLVYARAVVHEAVRLYPPAFTLARQAITADVAGGVRVPARAVVLISPWVLHRHRRLWQRPGVFDPNRFLPGVPPPDRFAYLPFGIGPRVCIGAQFALTEATLVLAALMRAFQIERAGDEPVTPRAIVTTQPDHPPLFRLKPRRPPLSGAFSGISEAPVGDLAP